MKPHSVFGQPTVAAMPKGVEVLLPWKTHSSTPFVVADDLRDQVLALLRDVVLEHVRRLDEVVVDAHEDHVVHLHGAALQIGFGRRDDGTQGASEPGRPAARQFRV